ncbi:hypothetical protein OG782_00690 [Streptomyces sp. NBC_00876]|uniref:hypothetical protein n=1 Tax=Streptomyces sp. NBC_00876 TaxID=2975853 RepID=UPI003870BFBB|nr:hypothetical protein OG782_00690 [Streptomyces sp. NBC_00876]
MGLVRSLRGGGGAATEIWPAGTFTEAPYAYTAEPASSAVSWLTGGADTDRIQRNLLKAPAG